MKFFLVLSGKMFKFRTFNPGAMWHLLEIMKGEDSNLLKAHPSSLRSTNQPPSNREAHNTTSYAPTVTTSIHTLDVLGYNLYFIIFSL